MWRPQVEQLVGETTSTRGRSFQLCLAVVAGCVVWGLAQRALAFGGLWSSPPSAVAIVAERVIVVDNPDATVTTIVQLTYSGRSDKLVWIIPTRGHPRVGASSSVVFQRLDYWTSPEYWIEVSKDSQCNATPSSTAYPTPGTQVGDGQAALHYEHEIIATDSAVSGTGPSATAWLEARGYATTERDRESLQGYLSSGYNLLAVSLPGGTHEGGVLPPLILTYEEPRPSLPLSLTAAHAGSDIPVHVWLFGPSQAVATNQNALVINDARVDWLRGERFPEGTLPHGGAGPSAATPAPPDNYRQVVAAAIKEAGGAGFVTEMAVAASQIRDHVWSAAELETHEVVTKQRYKDGIAALVQASSLYHHWDIWTEAVAGSVHTPAGVTVQQLIDDPVAYRGRVEVDIQALFNLIRVRAIDPIIDTSALLQHAPYMTRLVTVLHADTAVSDPVFDYNPELAQIRQIHTAKLTERCDASQAASGPRWTVELPQGGVVTGTGDHWPVDETAPPANLKVVALTTSGAGSIAVDNTERIGAWLSTASGMPTGPASASFVPHDGLLIGAAPVAEAPSAAGPAHGDRTSCSLAAVGTSRAQNYGLGLVALVYIARLRWRLWQRARAIVRSRSSDST